MVLNNLPSEQTPDKAYPWVAQLLPVGIKGVVFAALAAAIVSSLASMLNSTAVYAVSICHKISHQDCHDLSSKLA